MTEEIYQIYGKVQGVNFRSGAKQKAETLKITGFAENKPDGSIMILAQGEDANLDLFRAWAKHGPQSAQVQKFIVTSDVAKIKYDHFQIK